MRGVQLSICVAAALAWAGCGTQPPVTALPPEGNYEQRLTPLPSEHGPVTMRRTVYVPVYSNIYWGTAHRTAELTSTVSVRNVDEAHPLIIESVSYYDSEGAKVQDYITSPALLGPLATVDFVVPQLDSSGGAGANFLIRWASTETEFDEPLIEAVMVGQIGTVGISFTSRGQARRVVRQPEFPAAK